MLQEIDPVKQNKGEFLRKWFEDDLFDLIVWYDEDQAIIGFQLCYDKSGNEHALTCLMGKGYSHHRIDTGEKSVWEQKAPILRPDGAFPHQRVLESFLERSNAIDSRIAEYVTKKIKEYVSSSEGAG